MILNIAEISSTFPPYLAGTGNVCYHNSIELAKLGHNVTVFTSRYPDIEMSYSYSDLIKVKRFKPIFRFGNAPLMPQLLEIKNFDIIHLHYPYYFGGEIIYLISKLRKQKYVVTYHQDVILKGFMNIFPKIHRSTLFNTIINNASKICVTSCDHARNSFIKKIVEKRNDSIIEIPNGVDINVFRSDIDSSLIRKKLSIDNHKIVLFVGALDKAHYFKGVEYLLKSFTMLKNDDAILIIIGDGDLKEYYRSLAEKLGVGHKTVFAGRISDEDLPKYYHLSEVVVLSSISVGEIFGIVLIEAMSTEKPVIATNLPGVRSVVDDGINGFLVKPKDIEDLAYKIDYMLDNDNIRRKFGKNGRKKVENFYSWEKIGKKLEIVYEGILKTE